MLLYCNFNNTILGQRKKLKSILLIGSWQDELFEKCKLFHESVNFDILTHIKLDFQHTSLSVINTWGDEGRK